MSWFPNRPHNAIFDFIVDVTDPVMRMARRFIPPVGMLDISVIVLLIFLDILKTLIISLLSF